MKIDRIDRTPLLYRRYKDKRIKYGFIKGNVVGYFFNIKCEATLMVEMKQRNRNHLKNFIKNKDAPFIDYHGDPFKCFFCVTQDDFDRKFAYEIEL